MFGNKASRLLYLGILKWDERMGSLMSSVTFVGKHWVKSGTVEYNFTIAIS